MKPKRHPIYRSGPVELYSTARGWRWRLRSRTDFIRLTDPQGRPMRRGNHRIVAASSEAFATLHGALRNLRLTLIMPLPQDLDVLSRRATRNKRLIGYHGGEQLPLDV